MDAASQLSADAKALVDEFKQMPGLTEADTHKSAFVILALRRGWTKAKIGRYLGISRARVGQKVAKCEQHAANCDLPVLQRMLSEIHPNAGDSANMPPVAFTRAQWDDQEFAYQMLNLVA
jgi:hypothetical protein